VCLLSENSRVALLPRCHLAWTRNNVQTKSFIPHQRLSYFVRRIPFYYTTKEFDFMPKENVTNSMEQSSWEANSHSASEEVLRLLWNPNVHYRVHKSPLLVPILSQMNPVNTFSPYFLLSPHLRLGFQSALFLSELRFKIMYRFLISIMRATCPAHLILLDLITLTIFGEAYKLWRSTLCVIRKLRFKVTYHNIFSSHPSILYSSHSSSSNGTSSCTANISELGSN